VLLTDAVDPQVRPDPAALALPPSKKAWPPFRRSGLWPALPGSGGGIWTRDLWVMSSATLVSDVPCRLARPGWRRHTL